MTNQEMKSAGSAARLIVYPGRRTPGSDRKSQKPDSLMFLPPRHAVHIFKNSMVKLTILKTLAGYN